jgi:hypothetical protein
MKWPYSVKEKRKTNLKLRKQKHLTKPYLKRPAVTTMCLKAMREIKEAYIK